MSLENKSAMIVSKREITITLTIIGVLMVAIFIGVCATLYSTRPPPVETYIFPNNTYSCIIEGNERVCALKGPSPTSVPSITIELTPTEEVSK